MSIANSGAQPVKPNTVVLRYFSWPAKSMNVMTCRGTHSPAHRTRRVSRKRTCASINNIFPQVNLGRRLAHVGPRDAVGLRVIADLARGREAHDLVRDGRCAARVVLPRTNPNDGEASCRFVSALHSKLNDEYRPRYLVLMAEHVGACLTAAIVQAAARKHAERRTGCATPSQRSPMRIVC